MPGTAENARLWWRGLQCRKPHCDSGFDVVGDAEPEHVDEEPGGLIPVRHDQHRVPQPLVAGHELPAWPSRGERGRFSCQAVDEFVTESERVDEPRHLPHHAFAGQCGIGAVDGDACVRGPFRGPSYPAGAVDTG